MDKKAKDILFKTYWSSQGWKGSYQTDPADFAYAKSMGVMFDKLSISKQELLDKLKELLRTISKEDVANAFLSSLTNKRLELRSAFASWVNASKIIQTETVDGWLLREKYVDEDLNVMNSERLKWGGVRHSHAIYNYLDLTLFSKLSIDKPSDEDIAIFCSILEAINQSAVGETPSKLRDRLKDVYKSSKEERSNLLEILGCCHILQPGSYKRSTSFKSDWQFVEYWRGEDKFDANAVFHYFQRSFDTPSNKMTVVKI
ncbi:hypothetical protein [Pinibacter soli]|uniref:DUF4942 domain-containing protein n=1 Tax=Pinibacter soli TaxID=3044211 RepID=A0ABT6RAC4_9BACT|nr:hypothetical protein [Pinibacter soli]MDI3319504.1 hypothetical protein [Pinibacter soli]